MNFSMIRYVIGLVMLFESAFLSLPCLIALIYHEKKGFSFWIMLFVCLIIGILLVMKKPKKTVYYAKEGFLTVAISWIVMSFFGALPFVINGDIPSVVDGLVRSGFWHSLNQTLTFTYDNSRLSSYDCGYDYVGDISWDNNYISQATNEEFIYSGKTCKGYNPYIVDEVSGNPFYYLAIAQPRLFGLHVNQLPEKIKMDNNAEVSFSYELDKEGYLAKVTATYHGDYSRGYNDGESEIYEYTWK